MKIAFFSDIHGNKYVLDAFFRHLVEHNVDISVFCGDVFGYYYYQEEILNRFRSEDKLFCIRGNHDQMFLDMLEEAIPEAALTRRYGNSYKLARQNVSAQNIKYLKSWPLSWEYSADGLRIAAFHGGPNDQLNERIYPDTPLNEAKIFKDHTHLILGHTHHKMERRMGNCLVLNPGSIGQQRDGKGSSFIILDTVTGEYNFYNLCYDVALLHADVEKYDPGNYKLIEVLYRAR